MATEGKLVPAFTAIAKWLKCSWEISPSAKASLILEIYTEATNTLSDTDDKIPLAMKRIGNWFSLSASNTMSIIGLKRFKSMITATMVKNTHKRAVNGKLSVKAWPISLSLLTPVKVVARMITERPTKPTAAMWKAKPQINQIQIKAWKAKDNLSLIVKAALCFSLVSLRML